MKVWICYTFDYGYPEDPSVSLIIEKVFLLEKLANDFCNACRVARSWVEGEYTAQEKHEARLKLQTIFGYRKWEDAPDNVEIAEGEINSLFYNIKILEKILEDKK